MADQQAREQAHDKSSHLWKMADQQDVNESRFPPTKAEHIPLLDDSHIAMSVNLDACIQCNLCVRACREVQVNDVIGMAGRGHESKIVFDFDDKAAKTNETEALRSVAINSAAFNFFLPFMIAWLPLIFILAPILFNSGICINLFSKIFSVILEIPLALHIKTMI